MKKSIIAAGAASVALAAMPIVGAFALSSDTVVDNINLTVSNGCTIVNNDSPRTVNLGSIVAGGNAAAVDGNTITLSCNATNWTVAALGTGDVRNTGAGATDLSKMDSGSVAATIATGTPADSAATTSAWGFKVAISESGETGSETPDGTIISGYGTYTSVPNSAQTIINGSKTAATITPSYKAVANSTQAPGAYEGQVTYTIAVSD